MVSKAPKEAKFWVLGFSSVPSLGHWLGDEKMSTYIKNKKQDRYSYELPEAVTEHTRPAHVQTWQNPSMGKRK